MPKVTDAHRESRREQILIAAWKCFSRNGFHSTSMADVIREAGLSAGAVYLYFRSKDEIIVAVATQVFGGIQGRLRRVRPAGTAAQPGRDRRLPGPATGARPRAGAGRPVPAADRGLERGNPQPGLIAVADQILGGLRTRDHRDARAVGGRRARTRRCRRAPDAGVPVPGAGLRRAERLAGRPVADDYGRPSRHCSPRPDSGRPARSLTTKCSHGPRLDLAADLSGFRSAAARPSSSRRVRGCR